MAGGPLALAVALALAAPRPADLFAEIGALMDGARPQEALELALSADGPTERAQATLYVLHHAGDLGGALRAGLDGLAPVGQEDPWLLERCTTIALDLGADDVASGLLARLVAAGDRDPQVRADYGARTDELRAEVRDLEERRRESASALNGARWTVGLGAITALGALLFLALGRPSVRRSE